MKNNSMWKDYPELDRIFNSKRISKTDKQKGSHIITKIMSESEDPKFTLSHQAVLKSELQRLEANLCNVFQHCDDSKQKSKKIKLECELAEPNRFYETVAEITWFSKWICKGILMEIEPLGKNKKGPDAKLTINGKEDVFCEVTALNIHATMEQKCQQENQIRKKISGIEPKYNIAITTDRELTDCDVDELSEFIKEEVKRNNGKKYFSSCYGDIHLEFADCRIHVVEICPCPKIDMENNQVISTPYKTDIERKLCNTICDKICQLNEVKRSSKVTDSAKVLVIDYGRPLGFLNLHPFFTDGYIKNIIGEVVPWGNHLLKFNSLLLKDLSAIIMVPHTADKNYPPSCYINEKADFIINRDEAAEITCIKQPEIV